MGSAGPPDWTRSEEEEAVRLLRLAGPRPAVSAERAERVRAAVRSEWRAARRRRALRRRVLPAALIAASMAALLARILLPRPPQAGPQVAVVDRVEGTPLRSAGPRPNPAEGAPVGPADGIRSGEWLLTDAKSRLALRGGDGVSVRIDAGSRARLLSARAVELGAGAVYVDSGRGGPPFEVRTPMGTARDVGTQFEVRLLGEALRVRVRSGVVEVRQGASAVTGRGGTEVLLSEEGARTRPLPASGPEWDWTARLAPPLHIEDIVLSAFLEQVAREQGWRLRYADPVVHRQASRTVLHGSVSGLDPAQALEVAIATSGLSHRLHDGELLVSPVVEGR